MSDDRAARRHDFLMAVSASAAKHEMTVQDVLVSVGALVGYYASQGGLDDAYGNMVHKADMTPDDKLVAVRQAAYEEIIFAADATEQAIRHEATKAMVADDKVVFGE